MKGLPGFERVHRRPSEQIRNLWNGRLLQHNHALEVAEICTLQQSAPWKRNSLLELRHTHWIVGLLGIALLGNGPARLRDCRFKRQDRGSRLPRSLPANQLKNLCNVGLISRLLVRKLRRQIVVAIRKAKAALTNRDDVFVRRFGVDVDRDAEDRVEECPRRCTHQPGEIISRHCRAELLNKRLDRLRVEGLRTGLIHEGCIKGADFCSIRAGASLDAMLAAFEDIADAKLHDIIQYPVNPIAVAIARDERAVIPGTIGISKEVVAGLGRRIHAGKIESPWSIFAGDGGCGLLGAADCLRSGQQDHDPCNRARYFTHACLLSLCLRRRARCNDADSGGRGARSCGDGTPAPLPTLRFRMKRVRC